MSWDNVNQTTPWTDARLEQFRKLFDEGLSFRKIAQQLGGGLTRNSTIGKAYRLGWTRDLPSPTFRIRNGQADDNHAGTRKRSPRKPKPRHNNLAGVNAVRKAKAAPGDAPVTFAPAVVDATLAKPWLERAFNECAYPLIGEGADTFSCCNPTGGHTYCAAHRRVMFNPSPEPIERLAKWAARRAA